ncbi:hypothetical protein [Microbacterium sp. Se5.02b]|nr:hypothetical protein [Microbacterium sp. Se5.02b]QNA92209.1 hypothetical protein G4G29_07025 [Microbacterium sp. Se63.02b]QYM65475.1 hypothetical protein K1X59_07085 [Microbacterium sp. Se5.02b]
MRRPLTPTLVLATSALLLLGCAPAAPAAPTPTAEPTPMTTSSSPAPTPEVDPQMVVSLDGITATDASGTSSADYDDPTALLALLEKSTGELPEPETVEIFPGEPSTLQRFDWDGLSVLADSKRDSPASLTITAADISGIPVSTAEGLRVGSTRAELVDTGAWALTDDQDAATATDLGLGGQEVPGTQSLTHPGSVGILFTLFVLEGDTVTRILVPSNDFSDL